jgi:hypothetical protein
MRPRTLHKFWVSLLLLVDRDHQKVDEPVVSRDWQNIRRNSTKTAISLNFENERSAVLNVCLELHGYKHLLRCRQ